MAYKTIMVYVDEQESCPKRLEVACRLAEQEGAHLIGLHIVRQVTYPSYVAAEIPASVLDQQKRDLELRSQHSKDLFEKAVKEFNVEYEWRAMHASKSDIASLVIENVRYVDLMIVGQKDPDHELALVDDLPERLVMETGRPTLIVPYTGNFNHMGEHAMIAWNASREAVRAVYDALPMLKHAKIVKIMSVNPNGDEGPLPGADLAVMLARHGVKAEVETFVGKGISIGDMLLNRMTDEGIDFLVMGGYGHSRLREMVLGGATRTILQQMTAPVLMSH